MSSRCNSKWV